MQEKPPIIISMGNDKYKYKDTIQIVKCDNIKIKQLNLYYCVHVEIQDWWTSINGIKKHSRTLLPFVPNKDHLQPDEWHKLY